MSFPGTDPAALGKPLELRLEPGFLTETRAELEQRGYRLKLVNVLTGHGGQIIQVDKEHGAYYGGSDPRVDGCAIGY